MRVKLVGENGNALAIIGAVKNALRRHGVGTEVLEEFQAEAMSGDYNHLLRTCMEWVDVE